MNLNKLIAYIWIPVSVVINAVSLINLQRDLFPALVKWVEFIQELINIFSSVKEFIFTPINYPLNAIFNLTLPEWLTTYIFIGFVVNSLIILSSKELDDIMHKELMNPVDFIFGSIIWLPVILVSLVSTDPRNLLYLKLMFKYFLFVVITIFAFSLTNFIFRIV